MRLRASLLAGSVLLAAAAIAAGPAADSALLRIKFPVGENLRYRQSIDLGQQMQGMDLGMKMDQIIAFGFTADPKGTRVAQTMESVKVTVAPGSPMADGIGPLEEMAKSVKVFGLYSPRGEVLDLKTEGAAGQGPGTTSMLRLGFMGLVLPEAAVSVGTKWTQQLDLSKELAVGGGTGPKQILPVQYEVKAMDTATVTILSTFSGDFKVMGPDGQSIDLKMTGVSTILLDRNNCLPKKVETTGANTVGTPMGPLEQKIKQTLERI